MASKKVLPRQKRRKIEQECDDLALLINDDNESISDTNTHEVLECNQSSFEFTAELDSSGLK